jgi:small GTP-binding protein
LNKLSTLPLEICQLTNLTNFDLWGNQLTPLPLEICQMTNVRELNLGHNQLTQLPPEICQLTKLKTLRLDDNPLVSPSWEIATQGIEAIRSYFSELKKGDQPVNEVKIILIGEGAAGKTSLTKALLGEAFNENEDATHGIRISEWEPNTDSQKIKINIWDFGGQEIMHATHQFFLSKRSLYVLVLNGRRDERPEYWLRHIESFGGDSPILIVLNKHDVNPAFDINRNFLLQKYPVIKGVLRTSCKTGQGIDRFREVLLKELAQMLKAEPPWPKSWFMVKQQIEEMGKPYISCDEYKTCCREAGITKTEDQEKLVDTLHNLGVAVHFKELALYNTYVLDPKWVTKGVYKIITAEEMVNSKGILHLERLEELLRQQNGEPFCYGRETYPFLLELMKKFELCYSLDEETMLIPQLLPVMEPKFKFDYAGWLQFAFLYDDFLPLSILSRFMVKLHKDINDNLRWCTGVVLEDKKNGSQAVVKADGEKRRINIWVNGPRRKEYLHFLWYSLREINATFEKLPVRERIPMPDAPERMADYETLVKLAERGVDIYFPDGSEKEYSVKELLGLVQTDREDEVLKMLRMIIEQLDPKKSAAEVLNSLFDLKPSIFGVGFNLNELFKIILAWDKQRQQQPRK